MFRAVGNRCAVYPSDLKLSVSWEKALSVLEGKGFRALNPDVETVARSCIGASVYRRAARFSEAPTVVDCSSFVKWVYGQLGIWLPRRSIQQREMGAAVAIENLRVGDLVFVTGYSNYYDVDPTDGVGHLGITMASGTVVHAANRKVGVIEVPLERFVKRTELRGLRRIIERPNDLVVLETPAEREVETSDDIRWILLQTL